MFTGLIESVGEVASVSMGGSRLRVRASLAGGAGRGDSVAVDGSCLTVAAGEEGLLSFDLSRETLGRTVASGYSPRTRVNLERAMRLGDRVEGHMVTGHVDCASRVLRMVREGRFVTAWIALPREGGRLVAPKGSVAVSGISLTVASKRGGMFSVALVPETLERTTAGGWRPGTPVNLEYDLLARYVAGMMEDG